MSSEIQEYLSKTQAVQEKIAAGEMPNREDAFCVLDGLMMLAEHNINFEDNINKFRATGLLFTKHEILTDEDMNTRYISKLNKLIMNEVKDQLKDKLKL